MDKKKKSRKMQLSEVPAAVLTFVFIALIGGVAMIILGEFKTDVEADGGWNGSDWTIQDNGNTTDFLENAQVGIGKIGNKLGLIGTILVLSVIIGLVITYFAIRNM